jgi:sugar phosphate isomerase/epimerase
MTTAAFTYCLNTSTLRGHGLGLEEEIEIAAEAGYDAIEPWVRELDAYGTRDADLRALGRRIADRGLQVPNVIGFFQWAVDDPVRRAAALEEARRIMVMCARIGCPRVAAPPFGVTDRRLDPAVVAERYRALLRVGRARGVVPMVEFWGISQTLGRLGEAVAAAVESGSPEACVLVDVYHMYKGGSPFEGLRMLAPATLGLVHVNDYPAEPPRATITDADRVYPGDGVAPLVQILCDLHGIGYRGALSLELFNEAYWQQDALTVARRGLEKLRALVDAALERGL